MKVKGWKEVFKFTFNQQIKTKSFRIGTAVMAFIVALIAFLADFLPTLFLGDELDKAERAANGDMISSVRTLYLSDETGYGFDIESIITEYGVNLQKVSADEADARIAAITESEEAEMVARITENEYGFSVDSRYAGNSPVIVKSDCEMINSLIAANVRTQYLAKLGVPEDKMTIAMSDVGTSLSAAGQEPVSPIKMAIDAIVPMISSIILFVFIFSYSQLVAQAVAIEKSSRIIEYLLTSVKPLAIIIGKVIAMCCVSLLQFFIIGLGGTLGFLISLPFGILTKVGAIAASAATTAISSGGAEAVSVVNDIQSAFSNVNVTTLIVMVVTFILGFLFYAGLAGLAGASISKMEDLSSAIQPLSLVGVLGFYLAYFPQVAGEENVMSMLARYIPISSPFVLTSDYMLGKIGLLETVIAILILAAADVLIMMFVAKVYETIILHTGNRLKVGDMLKMSK